MDLEWPWFSTYIVNFNLVLEMLVMSLADFGFKGSIYLCILNCVAHKDQSNSFRDLNFSGRLDLLERVWGS